MRVAPVLSMTGVVKMKTKVELYYDVMSPFSWFAFEVCRTFFLWVYFTLLHTMVNVRGTDKWSICGRDGQMRVINKFSLVNVPLEMAIYI